MKLIIDIPDNVYQDFKHGIDNYSMKLLLYNAIDNGTPLAETNKRMSERRLYNECTNPNQ